MRRALRGRAPGLRVERSLWSSGADVVAGVDEVGRGSWAGPLTVAAVVANADTRIYKVRDSKMLKASERESLHDRIVAWARAVSVGHATVAECTELGMADAQRLAARRAMNGLGLSVDHVLVDGSWDFVTSRPDAAGGTDADCDDGPAVTTIVRGDASSLSIAAASVVAKVTRDRLMVGPRSAIPPTGSRPTRAIRARAMWPRWLPGVRAPSIGAGGCSWMACAGAASRAWFRPPTTLTLGCSISGEARCSSRRQSLARHPLPGAVRQGTEHGVVGGRDGAAEIRLSGATAAGGNQGLCRP